MNNSRKAAHWDAWGHPILDMFDMKRYYMKCSASASVLKTCLPHMYIVVPDVFIRILKSDPKDATLILKWPGGSVTKDLFFTDRQVAALRRLYRSKRGEWKVEDLGPYVQFSHLGQVMKLKYRKYGLG